MPVPMIHDEHLVLRTLSLAAGAEWVLKGVGWVFLRVEDGVAYWRQDRDIRELGGGDVLVIPCCSSGTLLASRLGSVTGHFFLVHPDMLSGILSLAECQRLRSQTEDGSTSARFFPGSESFGSAYSEVCRNAVDMTVEGRLRLLQLFVVAFRTEFEATRTEIHPVTDLGARMRKVVDGMSEAGLAHLSLDELARRLSCSERHASRLFHSAYGISLRGKQTDLKLNRAKRLLTQTNAKIIEVAMESGYQSLSLFNAMFKRRFGLTPSAWRRRAAARGKRKEA